MNLNDFIAKYCLVEPILQAPGGGIIALLESVEDLARAWRAVSQSPVQPLKFALHLRSIIPAIWIQEIAPDEVIIFGLSLTPEARKLKPML
jgi:hypothetical protein